MRVLAALAAAAFVLGLIWLSGYDFNERGAMAMFAAIWSAGAAVITYIAFPERSP